MLKIEPHINNFMLQMIKKKSTSPVKKMCKNQGHVSFLCHSCPIQVDEITLAKIGIFFKRKSFLLNTSDYFNICLISKAPDFD